MNFHNQENQQGANIKNLATDVMNHWISCYVYTNTLKSVRQKLQKVWERYNYLKKQAYEKEGWNFLK